MSSLILPNRVVFAGGIVLVLVSAMILCVMLSTQRAPPLSLGNYHVYRCSTGAADRNETFNILTVVALYAEQIAEQLCDSPLVAHSYGAVQISWRPRGQLAAEEILNEEYDLIWSRIHNMRGLVPEFADYYDTLLRFDGYQVFWYSHTPMAQVTAQSLSGKKVGLLEDRLSHTHYLLPLSSLKEAGVDLEKQELVYFDHASAMYQAFGQGDLDLISAGLWLEQDLDGPVHRTLIADDAIAATLFVRKARDRAIDCELAAAFRVFGPTLGNVQRRFFGSGDCEG